MEGSRKRGFQMPTAYSILLIIIVILAVITHFILGDSVQGASLAQVIMSPGNGFLDAVDVCVFILVLGGFLNITAKTGALDAGVENIVKKLEGNERLLIPILMTLFSIGGTTFGMAEETMAFYILIVGTMIIAGFDAVVGVAVIMLGAGCGVLGSTVNPFAVGTAVDAIQSANADIRINQMAVIILGAILWITSLIAAVFYVMRYAKKVKEDTGRSLLSPSEKEAGQKIYGRKNREEDGKFTGKQKLVLAIFGISFLIMVISLIPWENFGINLFVGKTEFLTGVPFGEWYFRELQAWFLVCSIVIAIVYRMPEREAASAFVAGAADMVGVALVIAVSRGISVIMGNTGLDKYILNHASAALTNISPAFFTVISYIVYLGLSFLIPSTSGLAAASMPTFGGLAAGIGLSPEVMILIFSAACGVVNLITPTSAVVMGGLQIARFEWPTWLRFVWKFLLFLIVLNIVILSIAMVLMK